MRICLALYIQHVNQHENANMEMSVSHALGIACWAPEHYISAASCQAKQVVEQFHPKLMVQWCTLVLAQPVARQPLDHHHTAHNQVGVIMF